MSRILPQTPKSRGRKIIITCKHKRRDGSVDITKKAVYGMTITEAMSNINSQFDPKTFKI